MSSIKFWKSDHSTVPPLKWAFFASFMAHRWSTNVEDMNSSSRGSNMVKPFFSTLGAWWYYDIVFQPTKMSQTSLFFFPILCFRFDQEAIGDDLCPSLSKLATVNLRPWAHKVACIFWRGWGRLVLEIFGNDYDACFSLCWYPSEGESCAKSLWRLIHTSRCLTFWKMVAPQLTADVLWELFAFLYPMPLVFRACLEAWKCTLQIDSVTRCDKSDHRLPPMISLCKFDAWFKQTLKVHMEHSQVPSQHISTLDTWCPKALKVAWFGKLRSRGICKRSWRPMRPVGRLPVHEFELLHHAILNI